MNNKNEKIPTRDSDFNIYQQDLRKYLNTASEQSFLVKKRTREFATASVSASKKENTRERVPNAPLPVFNWERLGLTGEEMQGINDQGRDWDITYPLTNERHTRTPALVEEKNTIKSDFESYLRPLLGRMDKSPNITLTDRNALHLPERDSTPTRRPKITDSPSVKITSMDSGTLRFSVRMKDDASRASMNPLADAVEIRYKVGGAAPESVEECVTSDMSKKSIFFIKTGNTNAGKKLWCYLRWVNLSSPEQTGPFGTLIQAVIQ